MQRGYLTNSRRHDSYSQQLFNFSATRGLLKSILPQLNKLSVTASATAATQNWQETVVLLLATDNA